MRLSQITKVQGRPILCGKKGVKMRKFYVIKIINTDKAEPKRWYKEKEGKMYICSLNFRGTSYYTEDYIDSTNFLVGSIAPQFCQVLSTFECEDD